MDCVPSRESGFNLRRRPRFAHRLRWDTFIYSFIEVILEGSANSWLLLYRSNVAEFLAFSDEQILARLSIAYANRGYTTQYSEQTLTWERDLRSLRSSLKECAQNNASAANWGLLLEFSIPRKEKRIDAVLLINDEAVILEAKTGMSFCRHADSLKNMHCSCITFTRRPPNSESCQLLSLLNQEIQTWTR